MTEQRAYRHLNTIRTLFQIFAGCSLGLILGLACYWLSAWLTFAVLVAVFLVYAMLKRPEVALLGILMVTSSIVFEDQLPMISVGISLQIPDLLLLALFGIIIVRWLTEPGFMIIATSLDRPLLVFYGVTLLSTFIAIFNESVDPVTARRAIRILSYYLTFFAVVNLVRERRQLNLLINGIFSLAMLVAVAMVLQYLMGTSNPLLPGRVETLSTRGDSFTDVVRILPPGYSLLLVCFITIFCILTLKKVTLSSLWNFFQFCMFGIALVFTFLRSYWAALMAVFLILACLFRGRDRRIFFGWGLVILFFAALVFAFVVANPDSGTASLARGSADRLVTLFQGETFQGQDASLNWRKVENEYAISAIAAHPLIGMGMTCKYRPWDSRLDRVNAPIRGLDFRTFIHNGHLWILLQSGFLGYLSLIWLSCIFLFRGFRYWNDVTEPKWKGVVLGFSLAYFAVFISAVVNSSFMQWRWTPVIGIMMGVNEVVLSRFSSSSIPG